MKYTNLNIKYIIMLQKGDRVPDFQSTTQEGKPLNFSDYRGKKVIIFFYPKASTPTCTVEACNLNNHYEKLQKAGFEIIGVSADSVQRQDDFAKKHGFQYPLLADTERKVIEAFGVWGEKKFMGRTYDGIYRTTFVINEEGIVEHVVQKVKAKFHAQQILKLKG